MSLWFQFAAACFGLVAALCGLVREHGRGRLLTSCQPGSERERERKGLSSQYFLQGNPLPQIFNFLPPPIKATWVGTSL